MKSRPNILHIFTDQQRFDTIHVLNNPTIKTPNLDRLCKDGVAFTSAYTPCPVCVAARCSMIYGQYPSNTGCYENTTMAQDETKTFMAELSRNGYYTHGIGKCHFTPEACSLKGFDSREHQEECPSKSIQNEPYYKHLKDNGYEYVCEPNGVRGEMYYIPQPSQLPERLHPSTWIADKSIEFIESRKDNTQPWYLFSSFIHPHPPFTPPNPWHKLYHPTMMPLPNVPQDFQDLQTFVNKVQNRYKYKDCEIDVHLVRAIKAYYYACISFVDYQIGRILDSLEKQGLLDNTLILFTSDHGEHLGDYNCFGKRTFHDSCARVPMIVSMKNRFEGGKICDTPVSLVDVAPTFLNAAGVKTSKMYLDGVDLYDILTGVSNREFVFGQHSYDMENPIDEKSNPYKQDKELFRASRSTYMAVSKNWKYFYSAGDDKEFLFDRNTDLHETRNKAGVVFAKEDLLKMRNTTIEYLKKNNETSGIQDDKFKKFDSFYLPQDKDFGLLVQNFFAPWAKNKVEESGYTD